MRCGVINLLGCVGVARDGMGFGIFGRQPAERRLRWCAVHYALQSMKTHHTVCGPQIHQKFKLQNDHEFASEMVAADPHNLQYFPSFQSYHNIVFSAVKADYTAMIHAGRGLRSQKSFILSAIKEAGTYKVLYHAAQSFMDSSIPLYVSSIISKKISIREVGHILESFDCFEATFQSTAGWSDREYLLTHCTATTRCLDAKFVLLHNIPLSYLHHTQRDNEEFMLHLVQKDGLHLRHASERIRGIHTIVFRYSTDNRAGPPICFDCTTERRKHCMRSCLDGWHGASICDRRVPWCSGGCIERERCCGAVCGGGDEGDGGVGCDAYVHCVGVCG